MKDIGKYEQQTEKIIELALLEDTSDGDITSRILISPEHKSRAIIIAKEAGVVAGIDITRSIFAKVEPTLSFKMLTKDGENLKLGDRVAIISGSTLAILKAERTALNLLSRLSGVATETKKYVSLIKGTKAIIRDTRKTTPGLRALEKNAVLSGGGSNHRFNLGDGILIKDNHIATLKKSGLNLKEIISKARREIPSDMQIEMEVESLSAAIEANSAGVDIVLLDNMSPQQMKVVVDRIGRGIKIEASGGINLSNIRDVAATGVDYIAIGAITHSAKALDFSLDFES